MSHIILNITHISKKPYYFSTNIFQFLINFNMIIVLIKCINKFLLNGNKTRCTTLISHYILSKQKNPLYQKCYMILDIKYLSFMQNIMSYYQLYKSLYL